MAWSWGWRVISIIQAATQIQEMTLTFVPKIIAIFMALLIIAFPWIMDKMTTFTPDVFINFPKYIRLRREIPAAFGGRYS